MGKACFENKLVQIANSAILGAVILALVYIVATLLFIPGLILTLAAGAAYMAALDNLGRKYLLAGTPCLLFFISNDPTVAILIATICVWVGAQIGSCLAFLLGRFIFREAMAKNMSKFKVFKAIDIACEKQGLKLTFLLRLSPLIPFNVFNYTMGVTSVKFKDYAIAGIGMLPGTIAYVYFGAAVAGAASAGSSSGVNYDELNARTVTYNADGTVSNNGALIDGLCVPVNGVVCPDGKAAGEDTIKLVLMIVGSVLALIAIIFVSWVAKKELNKNLKAAEEI